jgi:TolB-like protein
MLRTLLRLVAAALPLASAGPAAAGPPVTLAILPVVVNSLDRQEYLRDGIGDMLTTRLARSAELAVVPVDDPAQATTQVEAARATAREVGASYVLFGSFTRFGEGASLDLSCVSAEGDGEAEARSIFVQAGTLGEIIPRLDELTDKVVRHVTVGPSPPADVGAGPSEVPAVAKGVDAAEIQQLRERLDRLEQVIYGGEAGIVEDPLAGVGIDPGDPE